MENGLGTVLIIDDEKDIVRGLTDMLEAEQFRTIAALTGEKGLALALKEKPDLIILDLRLPDVNGYDICRQLRQESSTKHIPLIILSTRSNTMEKVIGLEVGADDYMTKPYNPFELLARVRAAIRRGQKNQETNVETEKVAITDGDLQINTETRSVKIKRDSVKLTPKEFDLLALLVSKPGKVFTRAAILNAVWGESFESLQGTVDAHIKTLRKKLEHASKRIETVPTIGYRWSETDQ